VPRDSLVYRGQQAGVYVLQAKRPVFRPIETGLTRGVDVEVVSNLDPGTEVISRGASMLTDSDQIRITRPDREQRVRDASPEKADQLPPKSLHNDLRKSSGEQIAKAEGQD
jgi:hypothetical protein